jgi:tetratricopeptide (TPR) repeat protein
MEVTRESPPVRWLILAVVWAFVTTLAVWHTQAMRGYVGLLDKVGTPAAADATPLRRPLPTSFADAQAWVRYALACDETGAWQLRYTDIDNAPRGRELHWSSAFAHLVARAGRIQQRMTGEPLPRATENALAWFNLPLLLATIIIFSSWAAVRAGAGAGVLIALGMVGHRSFYDAFAPNYADHQTILNAAAFGLTLGAMFMGAGWWRATLDRPRLLPDTQQAARRAAIGSALSAAVGMWISAASLIPVIGAVGLVGLAVTVLFGRRARADGAVFDPGVWRLWGRVGAIACIVFYLFEYAPGHLGIRLEVNHPFHALAWWGGSELIALLGTWHLDRKARPKLVRLIVPVAAVVVAPLTILVAGTAAFMVRDPFVADLRHMVGEGMSFRAASQSLGVEYSQRYLINFILTGCSFVALWIARRDRVAFGFIALLSLAFVIAACLEIRWWLIGSAPLLGLVLAMVAVATTGRSKVVQWSIVLGISALLLPAGAISGARTLNERVRTQTADESDLLQPLYRDIAATLRANQPKGDIILLASPDASNGIGYYGRFKTIGTLYWENVEGLKAAAAIYCAERDDDAKQLILARGITHLALISKANFIAEFFQLFRPEAASEGVAKTFAHRVLVKQEIPRWLRAIPYRAPANMAMPNLSVLLFQVVPDQSEPDARWNLASAQLAIGNLNGAEQNFRQAIALAPVTQRVALHQAAGDLAYQQHAHALAIRLYRAGLALGPDSRLAGNLAWALATTPDATLRNGREALALAEPALAANPNDAGLWNTMAAALAENGRFPEAAKAASQALQLARPSVDNNVAALLQRRIDTYQAGRPWRE